MKVKDNCPNCDKYITILWEQIFGIRLVIEKDKKEYLIAKCPECGFVWNIQKQEILSQKYE